MRTLKDRRSAARRKAALAALGLSVFAFDVAKAASTEDCPVEIEHFETVFPEGMPKEWVEGLLDDLAGSAAP